MGGHPDLKVAYTWDDESSSAQVSVSQTQTTDDLTPLFRAPVDLVFVTPTGSHSRRVTISKAQQTFHFSLEEKPVMVSFDPGLPVPQDPGVQPAPGDDALPAPGTTRT